MKVILVAAAIIFFSVRSSAQFEKGNYLVGGSFEANFTSPANSNTHNHHIGFDPRVGYYFMNGFASGIDLTTAFNKNGNTTSNELGGGPFVRYHILKYLYAEVSYQFLVANSQTPDPTKTTFINTTVDENKYAGGLGYIFRLSNHLAIEPRLFYNLYTSHSSPVSSGPVFSIGFHNYFWRRE